MAPWLPEVVVAAILEAVSKVELGEREGSEMDGRVNEFVVWITGTVSTFPLSNSTLSTHHCPR